MHANYYSGTDLYNLYSTIVSYDTFRRRYDNDASSCAQMISPEIVILDLAKLYTCMLTIQSQLKLPY